MAKAVIGQSLRITSTLGIDLTTATSVYVWYKSPTGTIGSVAASVTTAETGVIYADIPASVLSVDGVWYFMVKITLASGNVLKSFGELVEIKAEYAEE